MKKKRQKKKGTAAATKTAVQQKTQGVAVTTRCWENKTKQNNLKQLDNHNITAFNSTSGSI